MRAHDLLRESTETITLYRGDASKIEQFSTEATKNSIGLLFGHGIYLTDNIEIAKDYSLKGGYRRDGEGTVMFSDDFPTRKDALKGAIMQLMYDLGIEEKKVELRNESHNTYDPETDREANFDSYVEKWREVQQEVFEQAKEEFVKRGYQVFKGTMGWNVVKPEHTGVVTTFEVPADYTARCLHGDRPLEGKGLEVLRGFINGMTNGRVSDFRDRDNSQRYTFDEWLEVFKTEGSFYAWEDHAIGGQGVYPTLGEVMQGTHGGQSIFYRGMDQFIEMMQAAGFTGIEYDGGVRMGNMVRGLGGVRHRAFVFWDDDAINSCMVNQDGVKMRNVGPATVNKVKATF